MRKYANEATGPVNAENVREIFNYDPDTGEMRWRNSRDGAIVGWVDRGRRKVNFQGAIYQIHRLAWLYVHGEWPALMIDHINGDPSDNRIANLRVCTNQENMQNISKPYGRTSRFKGVSKVFVSKWRADIRANGKNVLIGQFHNEEDAARAYDEMAEKEFGEFAKTNKMLGNFDRPPSEEREFVLPPLEDGSEYVLRDGQVWLRYTESKKHPGEKGEACPTCQGRGWLLSPAEDKANPGEPTREKCPTCTPSPQGDAVEARTHGSGEPDICWCGKRFCDEHAPSPTQGNAGDAIHGGYWDGDKYVQGSIPLSTLQDYDTRSTTQGNVEGDDE